MREAQSSQLLSHLRGAVARPRGRHPLLEAGFVEDVPADLGARFAGRQRPRALALVAVAAGQIEATVDVALLGEYLRVPQDEAVRVVDGSRARSNRLSSIAASESTGASWSTTSIVPPGRSTRFISASTSSGRGT